MLNTQIKICENYFKVNDIKFFLIECKILEPQQEDNKNYSENNYLSGFFSLAIAGLASNFIIWRQRRKKSLRILKISTEKGWYVFTEKQVNITEISNKLRVMNVTENKNTNTAA